MRLVKHGGEWVAVSRYEEREIAKGAGFRWDPDRKRWYTRIPDVAARLRAYADPDVAAELDALARERETAIAASRATSADVDIPAPPGLAYLPFQLAGIAYALSRPATLIADEMGLGKTIQAIGVINAASDIRSAVVVCPAAVKLNWARELERWLTRPLTVGIIRAGQPIPATDILIVNWELLDRLPDRTWDLVILDEAQYAKNPKAKRTQLALALHGRRKLALTGTPILNRPIELWPLLHAWLPGEFRSWYGYVTRYCAGYQGPYGWDVSGASNLSELQERLRATIMVRRRKADVLSELPPKRRQIVELEANGLRPLVEAEQEAFAAHEDELAELRAKADLAYAEGDEAAYRAAVERLREAARVAFEELSRRRHELALAKLPSAIAHVTDAIESGPVVAFAHHRDVAEQLAAALPRSVLVTGDTPEQARQAAVDAFQAGEADAFVGTIGAAGVGITLTRASHVVFAELDWVPARISQAEDRCHRIGQAGSVLVQHLVVDGSLDARLAKIIVAKQTVIDAALDDPIVQAEAAAPVVPIPDAGLDRRDLRQPLPPEVVAAAHEAMRYLAATDHDRARLRNEVGFSRYDSTIGHALAAADRLTVGQARLARKLALRYRRQLPPDLVARLEVGS